MNTVSTSVFLQRLARREAGRYACPRLRYEQLRQNASMRQRGQALMLALALLVFGAAGLVQLYDGGQIIAEKSRLVHATDAAAYSGALVQARALNFQAYANRAQIAHQVAMAHLVTLASWADFGTTEAQQLARGNPPGYLIGMLFGPAHGTAYHAAARARMPAVRQAREALHDAFLQHDAIVHDVLWRAQMAVTSSLPAARAAAMQAVLDANYAASSPMMKQMHGAPASRIIATDTTIAGNSPTSAPPARLDSELLSDELPGALVPRHGAAREHLRELVLQAANHYEFLFPRHYTAHSGWTVSSRCPHLRHQLRRRGGTSLEGFDVWRSDDTQSYHALRSNRWIGCYYREYPMGWAEIAAGGKPQHSPLEHVDNPPNDFSEQDFWRWAREHTPWDIHQGRSNPLANSHAVSRSTSWRGRGMPGTVDLAPTASGDAPTSIRFAIRVTRPQTALATTDAAGRVNIGAGLLRMPTRLHGQQIAAISAAQTWFERPTARSDGFDELASLFNPYWQARLVAVTENERSAARQKQLFSPL